MEEELTSKKGTLYSLWVIAGLIFVFVLLIFTHSGSIYYADACVKTNATHIAPLFKTDSNINAIMRIDCSYNMCVNNPDKISESYCEYIKNRN